MTDLCEIRDILGYPGYRITNQGTVYSCLSGRWRRIRPYPYKLGCSLKVALRRAGKTTRPMLGRLVLETFEGPSPSRDMVCVHIDGDPDNCRIDNLRWGSRCEAIFYARGRRSVDGRHVRRGEANPRSRLTEANVIAIRAAHRDGATCASLAREYGVSNQTVAYVVSRTTWKHVPDEVDVVAGVET